MPGVQDTQSGILRDQTTRCTSELNPRSSAPGPLPRAQSLPAALLRAGYSPGAAAHAAGAHVA